MAAGSVAIAFQTGQSGEFEGVGRTDFAGYKQCVKIENAQTRVVLGHQCGGRVLEYAWKGTNAAAWTRLRLDSFDTF